MNLTGFSLEDDFISIRHEGECLDLHNDYCFVELRHRVQTRTIELVWSRRESEWTSPLLPGALSLHFSNVDFFKVAERDPDMPWVDDDCAGMIGFMWNDLPEEMRGCAKVVPEPGCDHFVVVFHGYGAIKIGADDVRLEISVEA
jgi:hypothetical protein